MSRIYLSPPHVSSEERRLLLEAFDSNWIAPQGPHVDAFEREFSETVGVPYAVALSSGTAALHLGLLLLGVGPGDEVITSTLTFAATANAITYRGARPVFIDADRATWNMDADLLAEELKSCAAHGKLPKAVLVVDLYGQCADYERILTACDEYGVPVFEDAAEALGSTYRGHSAGHFGSLAAFSFNGNKIITTSGGGMLVSHRSDWIERARFLSTQARDHAPHYQHSEVGYNYRMSNLLAAVGRGQLKSLSERVHQRRANNAFYRRAFVGVAGVDVMPEAPYGRSNDWLTCVTVDPDLFGATREDIRLHLETLNIEARPVWKAMHLQPAFASCRSRGGAVALDLFERGLCLPSGSALTTEERERVATAMLETPRIVAGELPARVVRPAVRPKRDQVSPLRPTRLVRLKRQVLIHGRLLSVAAQLALVCLSNVAAFWLRFDGDIPPWAVDEMLRMLPWVFVIRALTFQWFRVYEGIWQYAGLYDLRTIVAAVSTSTAVVVLVMLSRLGFTGYPRSIIILDSLLLICSLVGIRLTRRVYEELSTSQPGRRVIVMGAGTAGQLVVRDMRQNRAHGLTPVGFIDDDPQKRGRRIHGLPVFGGRRELATILRKNPVDEIVVALPSASPSTMKGILRDFEPFRVGIKTLPSVRELLNGRVGAGEIRALRMDDLLERAPVGLDTAPLRRFIEGRRVLITGAGGAAGAELARQIAALEPEQLILFERSDRALKAVMEDLERRAAGPVAVLGDVGNERQVQDVVRRHRPHLVFHAAVQNDVRLMEENPAEAVLTNVLGTNFLVQASRDCGVERFVLLSTTKAVNPNSVMGATRRAAELIVETMGRGGTGIMCGVRLSNVLGQPGSVVPRFLEQIRAGGPVTVPDPDVRRYFMLNSEAVCLVLHAAMAAEPGTLYVLDMGEQIKILDLARNLIRLEGFIPEDEIPIQFVGLQGGERLYDELASARESVSPGKVERVLRVRSTVPADPAGLPRTIAELATAASNADTNRLLGLLGSLVPEFRPEQAPTHGVAHRLATTKPDYVAVG